MSRRAVVNAARAVGVSAAVLTVLSLSPHPAHAESVELSVPTAAAVTPGRALTVTAQGADPLSGYYVATCLVGSASPKGPECLGDRATPGVQQWVSNSPGATKPLAPDGSFSVELTGVTAGTTPSGRQVDCQTDECAITVFHDHRNGFDTVSEKPITVDTAAVATQESPPDAPDAPDHAAAASSTAATAPTGWLIGGALGLAALGSTGFVLRSRRGRP